MAFRRASYRDERRRRVLIEEPGGMDGLERELVSDSPPAELPRRYTDAALSVGRCRLSDLVPLRWWIVLAWLGVLISCAAGMEAVYGYVALGYTKFDISELPAIDLSERASIATWFSSILLLACAVYGILIYQMRRHRVDDYRGRYRMWRWIIPLFLLASIDQVASIQESLFAMLWRLAPLSEYTNGHLLWHGSMAVVAAVVAGRLVIEMRACRLASLLLTASLGCFGVIIAARAGWLLTESNVLKTMSLSSLVMGSRILLLMAILLYARHVHRDAHGQLPVGRHKRRNRREQREERVGPRESEEGSPSSSKSRTSGTRTQDGSKVTRADPAHASRQKDSSKRTARRKHRSPQEGAASAESSESTEVRGGTSRRPKRSGTAGAAGAGKPSPARSSKSASRQVDDEAVDNDDAVEEKPRKLSKSERKRLRKERRQQRQAS
ncbi:MAG: hypothetical protein R6U98_06910 [Pirellulaceae bacterium]